MRVTVLDNDLAILRSLEIVLSERGHQVTTFADPVEACRHLARPPAPEVLILDYVMPGLTGVEVLERIGCLLRGRCRVILVSAHFDSVDATELAPLALHAVLPKPLDLDRICRVIECSSQRYRT